MLNRKTVSILFAMCLLGFGYSIYRIVVNGLQNGSQLFLPLSFLCSTSIFLMRLIADQSKDK